MKKIENPRRWLRACFALSPLFLATALGCATAKPRPEGKESAPVTGTDPLPAPTQATPEPAAKEAAVPAKEATGPRGVIPRTELNRVLDAAPGRFLAHIETEPRFVGGRFRGWRLASFFPGDARFAGVDLHAGDVVLAVNGKTLEQPDQLMEVWESLRFERSLVVSLERDGEKRQLRFEIRD